MIDHELDIIRYTDGMLTEAERVDFEVKRASDEPLRMDVATEQAIQRVLLADADRLACEFRTVPGAPLLTRFATTSDSGSDNKIIYYVLGAVTIIIAWLLFSLLRSTPTDTQTTSPAAIPALSHPSTSPAPANAANSFNQPIPMATQPATRQPAKPGATSRKPETIDLDKGLDPPKIYTDPKGHMTLEKK